MNTQQYKKKTYSNIPIIYILICSPEKCALQTDVIFANASRGGYVRRSHLVLDLSGMGELGGEPLL